ncbi:AaceriAEL340Wp [[Ashbya] aceris (nom. inval.)]|nr:AaceriAEL340Wp [[Ashbya] aceris (nom. inval.)]
MYWTKLLFAVASAATLVAVDSDAGDREPEIICSGGECYPKLFEALQDWSTIKEGQQIPPGLDIRVDFSTGERQARLPSADVADSMENSVQVVDDSSEYEFTKEFQHVRAQVASGAPDYDVVIKLLDDLVEYASDYTLGYKIITHEFTLLQELIFGKNVPTSVKELSSRIIVACLRNNTPCIDFVNMRFPDFARYLLEEAVAYGRQAKNDGEARTQVKRYLSIVEPLLIREPQLIDEEALKQLYEVDDQTVKLKVLLIMARLYRGRGHHDDISKRSLESTDAQWWTAELSRAIQSEHLDDFHVQELFHGLYALKKEHGRAVKTDPTFLGWLAEETGNRKERMAQDTQARDPEQTEFDRLLIESRHLVFGNPMAHRMKNLEYDEL